MEFTLDYIYDALGNILSITGLYAGTLGAVNPIRYRGYYYDTETGFYYLQSRYYDPSIGRFINADSFASTGQGFVGYNMFAYCRNSPNNYADHDGYLPVSFEYYIVDRPDTVVDLTDVLNTFMRKNAQELAKYHDEHSFRDAALYFYNNVKDGGALDIKLSDEWKFEDGVWYKYNGVVLRYDDPGNINFGYVGAVLFSEWILCFGAGVNQISKWGFQFGDITTFYDDPRDNEMIKYGYNLYREDQK